MDLSSSYHTQNSSSSDLSSPLTPTFSGRGHLRYPSSTTSIESPIHSLNDSPSSPTFVKAKRSLPDVQEEPQEKDDFDMFDDDLYDCLCTSMFHFDFVDRRGVHVNKQIMELQLIVLFR